MFQGKINRKKKRRRSKIAIYSKQQYLSTVLFSTWCGLFHFSSFQGFCFRSSSTFVFLIIKVIFFFIALCVAPFYEVFCCCFLAFFSFLVVFSSLFLDSVPPSYFLFWGSVLCSTLWGSFNLCYFTFFLSSISFWSFIIFIYYFFTNVPR